MARQQKTSRFQEVEKQDKSKQWGCGVGFRGASIVSTDGTPARAGSAPGGREEQKTGSGKGKCVRQAVPTPAEADPE